MENNNNTLAKIALAISIVLMILVIVLFTKLPSTANQSNDVTTETTDSIKKENIIANVPTTNIAFFNMDSLGAKLDLFKEIEAGINKATKDAESKMKRKQAEITNWEKKWASKGQLLSTEQEQYMKEAQNMQNDAMGFEQKVQMELAQKQDELMLTYATRISNHCKEFAEEKGYDAILAYTFGQNVWYYNPALDVTDDLAVKMNAAFAESTGNVDATDSKDTDNK
jgi:Skp family chaperone for outer membrane proteins